MEMPRWKMRIGLPLLAKELIEQSARKRTYAVRVVYACLSFTAVKALLFFMWAMAVMIVAVQSSSLIAGERSHQTLDVLCTTPLAGRDILLQKITGVRRLMILLWFPMLTAFWVEPRAAAAMDQPRRENCRARRRLKRHDCGCRSRLPGVTVAQRQRQTKAEDRQRRAPDGVKTQRDNKRRTWSRPADVTMKNGRRRACYGRDVSRK